MVGIGSNAAIASILERLERGETRPVESYGAQRAALPLAGKRVISTPRHYAVSENRRGLQRTAATYCAIPLIRGPLRSRTVRKAVWPRRAFWPGEGVKELIVVAQDITAFGADRGRVEIAPPAGCAERRWRASSGSACCTPTPSASPTRLSPPWRRNRKGAASSWTCPSSTSIPMMLRAMNRQGRPGARCCAALDASARRHAGHHAAYHAHHGISGETPAQFEELCEFVKDYAFDRSGCFAYSEEEGTVAAGLPQLPQELREQRAEAVMNIQANVMARRQEEKVGRTVQVMCDGYGRRKRPVYLPHPRRCPRY